MLRTLDQHWREHLAAMDYMRQGIFLRSYAQKNPKQEYKREAFELFSAMLDRIKFDTVTTVSKIQVRSQAEIEREELERQQRLARALQLQHAEAVSPIQAAGSEIAARRVAERRSIRRPARRLRAAVRAPRPSCGECPRWAATSCVPAVRARSTSTATARCSKRAVDGSASSTVPAPAIHVVAAAVIDAARAGAHRAAARGQAPGRRLGVSRRQGRARRDARAEALARELGRRSASTSSGRGPCCVRLHTYSTARCCSMCGWCAAIAASRGASTARRCAGAAARGFGTAGLLAGGPADRRRAAAAGEVEELKDSPHYAFVMSRASRARAACDTAAERYSGSECRAAQRLRGYLCRQPRGRAV